jgi:hypothetical protein
VRWIYCAWAWIAVHATILATVVSASAAIAIACFTYRLKEATKGQLGELIKSGEQARLQFIATHRPRIMVHSFEYSSEDGERIGAFFRYVNTGTSTATIVGIAGQITEVFDMPSQATSIGPECRVDPEDEKLVGGEEAVHTVSSSILHSQMVVDSELKHRGHSYLFAICIGYVAYTDDLGVRRKTGFCRRYDPSTRSWLKMENSDYEYAY